MIFGVSIQTIQAGSVLIASATFFGALVGSLTQVGIQWRNKKHQKENLRLALLAEIQQMNALELADYEAFMVLDGSQNMFPTTVYEAHTEEVGQLTEDEVQYIVELYAGIEVAREVVELASNKENGERYAELVDSTIDDLYTVQKKAKREIKKELNWLIV